MVVNDERMEYNYTKHRYILTVQGASEIADVTTIYKSSADVERQLDSISRSIYNWIYSHGNRANRNIVEYWLATNEQLRSIVLQAMQSQLEADVSSGYNDVKNQVGANFENNSAMARMTQAERTICIEAQQIIESSPVNVLYAGSYLPYIPLEVQRAMCSEWKYTELGY